MRRLLSLMLFTLSLSAPPPSALAGSSPRILVLGDSIGEGYQLLPEQAWPSVLEKLLKDSGHSNVQVLNRSISGSTSASGLFRLRRALKEKPTHLILELGGNDGLRALSPDSMKQNLLQTVRLAQKEGLRVLITGMKMPRNLGAAYVSRYEKIFREVAQETRADFLHYLLEGVGGVPELNLADGIHPNAAGQERVARNVLKVLLPTLKSDRVKETRSTERASP